MDHPKKTAEIHLWLWEYTDQFGKRRVSRWRMTEEQAAKYKDAVKVEGSLEIRPGTVQCLLIDVPALRGFHLDPEGGSSTRIRAIRFLSDDTLSSI
jgi:hypothetical protein